MDRSAAGETQLERDVTQPSRIELPRIRSILDPLFEPVKFVDLTACECFKRLRITASRTRGVLPDILLHSERLGGISKLILADIGNIESAQRVELEKLGQEALRISDSFKADFRIYAGALESGNANSCVAESHCVVESICRVRKSIRKLLGLYLYNENLLKTEFQRRISAVHIWLSLTAEISIECPICGCDEVYLSDEIRLYYLLRTLSRTFELQRLRWLHMTSALHFSHAASTHTRFAHGVGTAMTALSAMRHVIVLPAHDYALSLGEYLTSRSLVDELFVANLLHDVGHPPHSHVLEKNPIAEIDHESATRSLLQGKEIDGPYGSYSWHSWLTYFQNVQNHLAISVNPLRVAGRLKSNGRAPLIREVLKGCGIHIEDMVGMLEPVDFINCSSFGEREQGDRALLRALTDSDLDIDRIDHIRRDSVTTGLSLSDLRERELLQGIAVWFEITPLSARIRIGKCSQPETETEGKTAHEEQETREARSRRNRAKNLGSYFPWIVVSEESLPFWLDLLSCRELTNTYVFNSPENRFMCGVLNLAVACAIVRFPHLHAVLPIITDQILAHVLSSFQFSGTLVERLNEFLQGKIDAEAYHPSRTFAICLDNKKTRDWLTEFYNDIAQLDSNLLSQAPGAISPLPFLTGSDADVLSQTEIDEIEECLNSARRSSIPAILFYADVKMPKLPQKEPSVETGGENPGDKIVAKYREEPLPDARLREFPWSTGGKADWAPNLVLRQAREDESSGAPVHHRFVDLNDSSRHFGRTTLKGVPDKPLGEQFKNSVSIWITRSIPHCQALILMGVLERRFRSAGECIKKAAK